MTDSASGFTQVPNWLIEAMPKLTGAQVMVCFAVARRTLGWQKEVDTISLSQLHKDTGLDRETLIEATRWLSDEAHILTRTPEDIACDQALADVCGLSYDAISRELRLGLMSTRKSLQKAGATPEAIRAVGGYWRSPASPAARMAARERRPISPPSLKQVGAAYEQAQQWQAAADAQRARDAAPPVMPAPTRGDVEDISPKERYRRTFGLLPPGTAAPALVARGRS